jgi:hypothetical protein
MVVLNAVTWVIGPWVTFVPPDEPTEAARLAVFDEFPEPEGKAAWDPATPLNTANVVPDE